MTKAGNLSASFPDAPHDCKDVFWCYKSQLNTKPVTIVLVIISHCSFSNGSTEFCDHRDYEPMCQQRKIPEYYSIPQNSKRDCQSVWIGALPFGSAKLPLEPISVNVLIPGGCQQGFLDGYIVKMPSIYNKLLIVEIFCGFFFSNNLQQLCH